MNWWEVLIAITGALGGIETLKYFLSLRVQRRILEAKADGDDLHVLRETMEFLQEQLKEKEERFAEQTQLVRNLNTEVLTLTREKYEVEIELCEVRCNEQDCPFRKPPNIHTPHKGNKTREEYFQEKRKKE